jgi:hypothetical protein
MWVVEDKIMQITKEEGCINIQTEDNIVHATLTLLGSGLQKG